LTDAATDTEQTNKRASLIEMSERQTKSSSVQLREDSDDMYDQPGTSSTIKKFPGLARFRQKFQSVDQVSFFVF
jgi:hypothetical protein